MNRLKTRLVTLNRLSDIPASHDGMWDALMAYVGPKRLDELHASVEVIDIDGQPALWTGFQGPVRECAWCADASATTGLPISYRDSHSGGVLLLGVGGVVYEVSYGSGRLIIPDEVRDQRFGVRFLIRCLDPSRVQALVRHRPDARGRTDSTIVPVGAPAWTLGIAENAEMIRRIGGRAKDLKTTFGAKDDDQIGRAHV